MNPIDKIAKLCERRPHLVIATVAIVTLLLLPGIPKITTETKMETFIPKDYPSIMALSDVEKTFGGMRYESILVETKNGKVTDAGAIKSLLGLQRKILVEPALKGYAVEVESYLNYLFPYIMEDNQLLPDDELELAVQSFLSGPSGASVVGRWITPDQKICLMNVNVGAHLKSREAVEKTQYFENLVKSYAAEHGIFDASITGGYSTSRDMQKIIEEDNRVLLPAAVAMIIAILALAFRRVTDVVLPFVVIALAAI